MLDGWERGNIKRRFVMFAISISILAKKLGGPLPVPKLKRRERFFKPWGPWRKLKISFIERRKDPQKKS